MGGLAHLTLWVVSILAVYAQRGDEYCVEDTSKLATWCVENCIGEWEPWSRCDRPCAGGTQTRVRTLGLHELCHQLENPDVSCLDPAVEVRSCNEGCPYGVAMSGECTCPIGRRGHCCEIEIFCEFPDLTEHLTVEATWPATVGTVASFHCEDNYSLVGVKAMQCMFSGDWKYEVPHCEMPTNLPQDEMASFT